MYCQTRGRNFYYILFNFILFALNCYTNPPVIKKIIVLPFLLLILISFSACEFSTSETVSTHQKTIPADFKSGRENFYKEIGSVGKFEKVGVITTVEEKGSKKTHSITIHLTNQESAPETRIQLMSQAREIENIVKDNILNISHFDKIVVNFSQERNENGIRKNITFKTENKI